jgi:hypothetical protein
MKENLDDIEVTDEQVKTAALVMETTGFNKINDEMIALFKEMIDSDFVNRFRKPMLYSLLDDCLAQKDPVYMAKHVKKHAKEHADTVEKIMKESESEMSEKDKFIKQLLNKYFNTDDVAKVAADVVTNSMDDQERTELISLVIYEHFKQNAIDIAQSDPLWQMKEYNGLIIEPKKKHPLQDSPKINIVDCINNVKTPPLNGYCDKIEFVKRFDGNDKKYNCIDLFEDYLKNPDNFEAISLESGGINPYNKDANCMTLTFFVKEGEYIPYDEFLILRDFLEIETYDIFLKDIYNESTMGKVHHIKHYGTGERLILTILPVYTGDIKYETVKLDRNDGKVVINKKADNDITGKIEPKYFTVSSSEENLKIMKTIKDQVNSVNDLGVHGDDRIFEVNVLIKPSDNYVDFMRGVAALQYSNNDNVPEHMQLSIYWTRVEDGGYLSMHTYPKANLYHVSEDNCPFGTLVHLKIKAKEVDKVVKH